MCGMFGWVGSKPSKNFDITKFNVLGLFNDSRGGDGCGRVYNVDQCLKDADKNKKYTDLVLSYENPTIEDDSNYVLGHCRKASVGDVSLINTQPVILSKKKKVDFIMMHNGTLLNHLDLAKKYNVQYTKDETDSSIFAKVLYKVGPSVLTEYIGAGCFIWVDLRISSEKVYIFKGASRGYKTNDKIEEERPMYVWSENKDSLYFSSIGNSLSFIGANGEECQNLECNILYEVNKGKITKIGNYSRDVIGLYQKSGYEYSGYGYSKYHNYVYGDWDWDINHNQNTYLQVFKEEEKSKIPIDNLCNSNKKLFAWDTIQWNLTRGYSFRGKQCNGIFKVNGYGTVIEVDGECVSKDFYSNDFTYIIYFVDGYLISTYEDYICALTIKDSKYSDDNLARFTYDNWIVKNGLFYTIEHNVKNDEIAELSLYYGIVKPIFTTLEFTIDNGKITDRKLNKNIHIKESFTDLYISNKAIDQYEIIKDEHISENASEYIWELSLNNLLIEKK